jgi:hypothetical protein
MHVLEAAMVTNLRLGRHGRRAAADTVDVWRPALLRLAAAFAAVGLFAATMDIATTNAGVRTATCGPAHGAC